MAKTLNRASKSKKTGDERGVRIIVVAVGKEPEVRWVGAGSAPTLRETPDERAGRDRLVYAEHMPFADTQTCLADGVVVVYDDNGVNKKLRTNRWSILGDFALVRNTADGYLTDFGDDLATELLHNLSDLDWLTKNHPHHNTFLLFRNGLQPAEFAAAGNTWKPNLQFAENVYHFAALQRLFDAHNECLLAWSVIRIPIAIGCPQDVLITLQFADTPEGVAEREALRAAYAAAFPQK